MRTTTVDYTPASGSGRRWLFIGLATLIVLAALAAAFLTGRATAPAPGDPNDDALVLRDGVPVPTRHSVAGALTAAANYQRAGFAVSAGRLDPARAAAVMLAADATDTAKQVLAAPTAPADELSKTRSTYGELSVVPQSYQADRAVVQVWGVAATSSQLTPQPAGTEDWGRAVVTLTWDGSQWRVADQKFLTGPWPARSTTRMTEADGDFSFRFSEHQQTGWSYVPEP